MDGMNTVHALFAESVKFDVTGRLLATIVCDLEMGVVFMKTNLPNPRGKILVLMQRLSSSSAELIESLTILDLIAQLPV
jgi:hypothetical protein